METGKISIVDWQNASKIAEGNFEHAFAGQEIRSGYLSKANEKIILGTKSGYVITIS